MKDLKEIFKVKKNLVTLIVSLVLLIALPATLYLVKTEQIFKPRANVGSYIRVVDPNGGQTLTSTNNRYVLLTLSFSPQSASLPNQSIQQKVTKVKENFSLVKTAYAAPSNCSIDPSDGVCWGTEPGDWCEDQPYWYAGPGMCWAYCPGGCGGGGGGTQTCNPFDANGDQEYDQFVGCSECEHEIWACSYNNYAQSGYHDFGNAEGRCTSATRPDICGSPNTCTYPEKTTCWVGADCQNPLQADAGCNKTHQVTGSHCSQTDHGPYGDGCTQGLPIDPPIEYITAYRISENPSFPAGSTTQSGFSSPQPLPFGQTIPYNIVGNPGLITIYGQMLIDNNWVNITPASVTLTSSGGTCADPGATCGGGTTCCNNYSCVYPGFGSSNICVAPNNTGSGIDLTASNLTMTPNSPFAASQPIRFTGSITNIGSVGTGQAFTGRFIVSRAQTFEFVRQIQGGVFALGPGQVAANLTEEIPANQLADGNYTVVLEADSGSVISETNEQNNRSNVLNFTVGSGGVGTSCTLTANPNPASIGSQITFTATNGYQFCAAGGGGGVAGANGGLSNCVTGNTVVCNALTAGTYTSSRTVAPPGGSCSAPVACNGNYVIQGAGFTPQPSTGGGCTPIPGFFNCPSVPPVSSINPVSSANGGLACPNKLGDASEPCDNLVNLLDYNRWLDEFVGRRTTQRANFNPGAGAGKDNVVNLLDYNTWLGEFRKGI